MAKDYYNTLGVDRAATRDEIKRAYKRLAKKYHPDLNKAAGATEKFKEINEAAAVLGDDEKRRRYDQVGSAEAGPDFGGFDFRDFAFGGGGFDFDRIFESFFGGGMGRSGHRARRGANLRHDVELTLEEAATGVRKELALERQESCAACGGAGGKGIRPCQACSGSGMRQETRRTAFGLFSTSTVCDACRGTGQEIERPCASCRGTGAARTRKKIAVDIPAGAEEGLQLRVRGEGEAGHRGAGPGDLYVVVHIAPHEFFVRQGNDILLEVPVSFVSAALGDEIEVPTLNGKARLKIPPGTQPGTVFRMAGKGLPYLDGYGTGEQRVRVTVKVPDKVTKAQRQLLEEFAKSQGEDIKPHKSFF